jgi:hypothetical protein
MFRDQSFLRFFVYFVFKMSGDAHLCRVFPRPPQLSSIDVTCRMVFETFRVGFLVALLSAAINTRLLALVDVFLPGRSDAFKFTALTFVVHEVNSLLLAAFIHSLAHVGS